MEVAGLDGRGDGALALEDMRMVGADTVIGKWKSGNLNAAALGALRDYIEPYSDNFVLYYVLRRV